MIARTSLAIAALLSASVAEADIFVEPLTAVPSNQTAYYVSANSGSDANDGRSPSKPFRRINHALFAWKGSGFKGGDVLVVMPGTYNETVRFEHPVHAGSAAGYTTLMAAPGQERPVIIGNHTSAEGSCDGCGAVNVWTPYVRVSGLDISAPNRSTVSDGVHIGPANATDRVHHVIIDGNVVHDSGGSGIVAVFSDYITMRNNIVYGNASLGPNQPSGINIGFSIDLDLNAGYHNAIVDNISYNNMNTVPSTHGESPCPFSQPNCHTDGNGIILDDHRRTQIDNVAYQSRSLVFGNTVFDNGGRGISIYKTDNVDVINNTSYKNLKDPLLINYPRYNGEIDVSKATSVTLYNNIAVSRSTDIPAVAQKESTGVTWTNNMWSVGTVFMYANGGPPIDVRQNKAGVAPLFVATSTSPATADFHLRAGSPAWGTGTLLPSLAGLTLSFVHSASGDVHRYEFPSRPNIGAYGDSR